MSPSSHLPLAAAQKAHESNLKAAEELFAKNQAVLKEAKAAAANALNDAELARRKEFLLKQREILLRKKKQERESDLVKFEADKSELESSPGLSEAEEMERKKAALKGALVQHLKTVHNEVEIRRAHSIVAKEQQAQQTLQEQLSELESNRIAKQAKLASEQELRKKQELERREAMAKMITQMEGNN